MVLVGLFDEMVDWEDMMVVVATECYGRYERMKAEQPDCSSPSARR